MKILFLDASHLQRPEETLDYSRLENMGTFVIADIMDPAEVVQAAAGYDVVITGKVPLAEQVISQLESVKLIVKAGTDYSKIDIRHARARGIAVVNLPGYGASSVGQYTIALMLHMAGNLGRYADSVRAGKWKESQFQYPIHGLEAKVLGLVGLGCIARYVIKKAQALGMQVQVVTKYPDATVENVSYVSLQELAATSDIISIHSALNDATRGSINWSLYEMMKSSVLIVNTARPAIQNEADTIRAVRECAIAGLALDGFWREPPEKDHPLFSDPRVTITPHVAWGSRETRQKMIDTIATKIADFFAGRCTSVVNDCKQ